MERNTHKNGLVNLLIALGAGVAAFAAARYSHSLAGLVASVYLGLGALVAAVSWFQTRLEDRERLERLELDELTRSRTGSTLFEAKDAEAFPARRAREQFERFFVPIFTVLLCLIQAGGAYFLWRWLAKPGTAATLQEPMAGMFLFFLFALVLFMVGRFGATFARLRNQRLLRPSSSYLLLNALLCAVVAVGIILVQSGFPRADLYVAFVLCGLLGLVALETLVALVLEIYRPRVKGKIERPLYESRLVGLLGQPEGLITTAAQAIDYQFGFKVSETWFYKFFIQAVLWLAPLQLAVLVLSTCVVIIEPGEQGLLERFGKPAATGQPLNAGLHFKAPWPVDQVYRFRTEQIQSVQVGSVPEHDDHRETVVLWTVSHSREENFLVANRDSAALEQAGETGGKRTPPVSLLTVSIPVQFQITNLMDWAYRNEDAPALLQDLATREVVRYLAGVDMNHIMAGGRADASAELQKLIQRSANERALGARIISVGLQDLHPPVKVAPDYEKVISALHSKQAKILAAQADQIRTNSMSAAAAAAVLDQARAQRVATEVRAVSQAGLFTNQIPAYQAAPEVYRQRQYLETFARATGGARKYVLLTTNTHDVITFDLQESIARDMLNLNIAPAKTP